MIKKRMLRCAHTVLSFVVNNVLKNGYWKKTKMNALTVDPF